MKQKSKIYFILIVTLVISGCFLLSNFVQAQEGMPELDDPLGKRDIPVLIGDIIAYLLGFVGVLALVMFIYGGITWMTSAGAAEKVKKGKDTLVWAIFGLAFIFFSYAILDFILKAFLSSAG